MTSLKEVRYLLDSHHSMKGLLEVYEEMAAEHMRDIRDSIVSTRDYYHNLATLSASVGEDLSNIEGGKDKTAYVLFSADEGMYGDVLDRVFEIFLHTIKQDPQADVYIVGSSGAKLMQLLAPKIHFTQSTDQPSDIASKLFAYKRVELFFGQFKNIATQLPTSRALTAKSLELTKNDWADEVVTKLKYIYEPSIKQVAEVFAKQIFSGVFDQTYKENELAKNASRLMHLDKSLSNIDQTITHDTKKYQKLRKRLSGKKQQSQFSGYRATVRGRNTYV